MCRARAIVAKIANIVRKKKHRKKKNYFDNDLRVKKQQ